MCLLGRELGGVLEWAGRDVEGSDGIGDNFGAESLRLGSHVVLGLVLVAESC